MAIRERKGRAKPFQVYWNNPYTGKREAANFENKEDALKYDSLVKHRLRFERESFIPVEAEPEGDKREGITLEQAYMLYLKEKQFDKKGLSWQMDCMRHALRMFGQELITNLNK